MTLPLLVMLVLRKSDVAGSHVQSRPGLYWTAIGWEGGKGGGAIEECKNNLYKTLTLLGQLWKLKKYLNFMSLPTVLFSSCSVLHVFRGDVYNNNNKLQKTGVRVLLRVCPWHKGGLGFNSKQQPPK